LATRRHAAPPQSRILRSIDNAAWDHWKRTKKTVEPWQNPSGEAASEPAQGAIAYLGTDRGRVMIAAMNKTDVQDKAQDWKEKATDTVQDLKSKAQDKARDLQQTARQWQQKAVESSRRAAEVTDDYVHENTWSVLVTVGLSCLILGILIGRGRD
jgi:ElaB/YqjD/DUF883 family membrane-anchored ribosome-binding protein